MQISSLPMNDVPLLAKRDYGGAARICGRISIYRREHGTEACRTQSGTTTAQVAEIFVSSLSTIIFSYILQPYRHPRPVTGIALLT
jgi:hypothetical protein